MLYACYIYLLGLFINTGVKYMASFYVLFYIYDRYVILYPLSTDASRAINPCWLNGGPQSKTLSQHLTNIYSDLCVYWEQIMDL